MVRRSWFETTALEMPAGVGQIHHRANLARNGWPGPHLRTGDVTLVFTTDETCSNVKLLLWERPLQQIPLHVFDIPSRKTYPAQEEKQLPGNQQPKYAFVALPLSYGYLADRQDSNLQPTN